MFLFHGSADGHRRGGRLVPCRISGVGRRYYDHDPYSNFMIHFILMLKERVCCGGRPETSVLLFRDSRAERCHPSAFPSVGDPFLRDEAPLFSLM